jgi:hypothetical protein
VPKIWCSRNAPQGRPCWRAALSTRARIAWIANGDEVYRVAIRREFATIKDGALYSCSLLDLTLAELTGQMSSDPDVLTKFRGLAEREASLAGA